MRWEAPGCDKFISPVWEDAMLYPADERNRRLSSGRRLTSSRHRWRSEQVVWQGKRPVPYNNRHSTADSTHSHRSTADSTRSSDSTSTTTPSIRKCCDLFLNFSVRRVCHFVASFRRLPLAEGRCHPHSILLHGLAGVPCSILRSQEYGN